jgi:putative restriction endonuclease
MAKAVFISKINSIYDDLPEERYHFPSQYLSRIEKTVGDWIIYYESRRNDGRQVYYATAQVHNIRSDPKSSNHYYAEMRHYLEFQQPVPFKKDGKYYEVSLLNSDGFLNQGKSRSAVHPITEQEYQLILHSGFNTQLSPAIITTDHDCTELAEEAAIFERPIEEKVINRPFRDRAFSDAVKSAYSKTCAMTGLCIINGGGRSEVQAAHIRSVQEQGPDSIRNGIALCGTVHWMFDRGLISLSDEFKILKAKGKIPEAVDRLLLTTEHILLPNRKDYYPHPQFLKFHREQVFKG